MRGEPGSKLGAAAGEQVDRTPGEVARRERLGELDRRERARLGGDRDDGVAEINAAIWVEREGQKAIVIGKGGEQLKIIGSAARQAMIKLFGRRVYLRLWVKVRENWSDDEAALQRFGYSD